jgi:hypothetical protein
MSNERGTTSRCKLPSIKTIEMQDKMGKNGITLGDGRNSVYKIGK